MEPMLGQIVLFAGNFTPRGWQLCAGQLMPINQNMALFSLLGTTFGGNGETNFALPDLRSQAPVSGANYIIAVEGAFPSRM
jgi:microcystin-dependent protein